MRAERRSFAQAIIGTTFWGLSGTAAQALFQNYGFPVEGLVTIRMLLAGSLLILILRPTLPRKSPVQFVALSVFGIAGSQVTYLAAIQASNAATATILQFLFLPIVVAYEAATRVLHLSRLWLAMLALVAVGTLFLVGGVTPEGFGLLVSPLGVLWGLLSACTAAYYTLASKAFVRTIGSWPVTAWGFMAGGLASLPFGAASLAGYRLPSGSAALTSVIFLAGVVVVLGTLLAYGLYLSALRQLRASEVGIVASGEPIAASAASLVFLGVVLAPSQYVGGALVVVAIALLGTKGG